MTLKNCKFIKQAFIPNFENKKFETKKTKF